MVVAAGLLLSAREGPGFLDRPLGLVGAPVQTLTHGVAEGVGSVVDHYVLLAGARREADRLRKEVADLRRELGAVEEVALENRRLKTLLGFKGSIDLPMLPARVVGRSASAWFRTATLDKGSEDGVLPNSPVVTAEGVVGRVYQVGPSASHVLLLTDTSSALDALVQRSRSPVVVEGRLTDSCRILYLARTDDARPGDRVLTSGLGDVFPKGLLIGEISKVEGTYGGAFRMAELRPSADFFHLEEVFVVLQGR
jgi:rod shape-determining protein MreC